MRSPSRFVHTVVGDDCPCCKISSVLHGNTNSLSLLRMSTSCDLNVFAWNCLQILRIHRWKIASPTSSRVQGVSNEKTKKDLCFELMHSTLFFLMILVLDRILLLLQMEWSAHQMVTWTVVHKVSGHVLVSVAHLGEAVTLHGFCPPTFLQCRPNQYWRSSFFHSSYSSFWNSICFGSAGRWSLTILIQLFASYKWRSRDVSGIYGSWVFFLSSEFSGISLRLFSWFGFSWITLNPLRCQVLHYHYISVMQSRFLIFIKNLCGLRL